MELLGRRLGVVAEMERGDLGAATRLIESYEQRSAGFRVHEFGWYPALWRAALAAARGDGDGYVRATAEFATASGDAPAGNAALMRAVQDCVVGYERGEVADTLEIFELAILGAGAVPDTQTMITGAWLRLANRRSGSRAEAESVLDTVAADADRLPLDSEWLAALAQIAEIVEQLGGHPVAEWTYDSLVPYRDLWVVEGIGAAVRGPVEEWLGILAGVLGRTDWADQHFDRASQAARRWDAESIVARIAGRQLGGGRSETSPRIDHPGRAAEWVREGEVWRIVFGGIEVRMRDTKGLSDLARLIARPGRELAALDLVGSTDAPRAGVRSPGPGGDLGPALDARAREAYRARIVEIQSELDEADSTGDVGTSERLTAERDLLLAELSAAHGLGGRTRRPGAPAERARTAVTNRIRDALRRIKAEHPSLHRHLTHSVRTGTFCVYDPEDPVDWRL